MIDDLISDASRRMDKSVAQALEEEGMRVLAFERFDVAE